MQVTLTSGFLQFLSESSYFSLKSSNASCSIFIHHSLTAIKILTRVKNVLEFKLNGYKL